MTRTMNVQLWFATASKVCGLSCLLPSSAPNVPLHLQYILCGVSLAEAAVLLAARFPSPMSQRILSLLLPSGSSALSALRLSPLSLAACLLGIAGGLTRIWCHHTLGRFFTWQVIVRRDHELVTSGPYALVRHPSYTGWLLMVAGNYLTLFNPHSYFAASGLLGTLAGRLVAGGIVLQHANVAASMMGRLAQEDAMLQKTFGDRWEEWARRTPCRLIPFIY